MVAVSFCLPLLTGLKSETLPLHIVSWEWQGKAGWCSGVDLDADGQDEIVFYDNGWWWAEWDGKPPTFQKIPIPIQAEEGRISHIPNLPSNIFAAHPYPSYLPSTPVLAPSPPSARPMMEALHGASVPPAAPPAQSAPPASVPTPNTSIIMDIWLVL
ncbi:MAG: hypothetical protein ACUVTP_13230, partial [Candidatus Fervidibacter sp.]